MTGEQRLKARQDTVWWALNDRDMLQASIPGCKVLAKTSETGFEATVTAKIGPVSATFTGAVVLSDIDAPNSYRISGQGKGGIAGFAKGGADVTLTEIGPSETRLTYTAQADVGGKIAQLGSRLISSTSKKLAGQFFSSFGEMAART